MERPQFHRFMREYGLFPGVFHSKSEIDEIFHQLNLMSKHVESRLRLSLSQFEKFCDGVLKVKFPEHSHTLSTEQALYDWKIQAKSRRAINASLSPVRETSRETQTAKSMKLAEKSNKEIQETIDALQGRVNDLMEQGKTSEEEPKFIEHIEKDDPDFEEKMSQEMDEMLVLSGFEPKDASMSNVSRQTHENTLENALEDQRVSMQTQIDGINAKLSRARLKERELEDELAMAASEKAEIEERLEGERRESIDLRQQFNVLLKQMEEYQEHEEDIVRTKQILKKERAEIDAEKFILRAEVNALENELQQAELREGHQRKEREKSEEKMDEIQKELVSLQRRHSRRQSDLQLVQRELEGFKQRELAIWDEVSQERKKFLHAEGKRDSKWKQRSLRLEMDMKYMMAELQNTEKERDTLLLRLNQSQERLKIVEQTLDERKRHDSVHRKQMTHDMQELALKKQEMRQSGRRASMQMEMILCGFMNSEDERLMLKREIAALEHQLNMSAQNENMLYDRLHEAVNERETLAKSLQESMKCFMRDGVEGASRTENHVEDRTTHGADFVDESARCLRGCGETEHVHQPQQNWFHIIHAIVVIILFIVHVLVQFMADSKAHFASLS